MYLWTLGIKDDKYLFHGRTWEEFYSLCEQLSDYFSLSDDRILICYIHNLSYEFQFMRKHFEWVDVFSIDERKPIKAMTSLGIEFKDSYILSGLSLERTAKNLVNHKVRKLVGTLDYDLIRHEKTEISKLELAYAKNDVIIILYYINEQIDLYGDITKIPLTNTGRVRKYVRHNCYYTSKNHKKSSRGKFTRYRKTMEDLQVGADDYKMLKRAFMGGFTHANVNKVEQVIPDVTSIDFTSSYPSVMVTEKFPMSKAIPTTIKNLDDFDYKRKEYCMVFDIKFNNIVSKISQDNYISESKCIRLKEGVINNGRVHSAKELIATITDVDFNIMENCYDWESIEIGKAYKYHKGYLPIDIIKSIIKLYEDKTVLKGVKGKEVEYVVSKGMLNSIYGMSVTDIIRDDIEYNEGWEVQEGNFDEQLEKYNTSHSRFLYYAWGVWVTAYSRRNLWGGIYAMGDDYIYSDTDSIKFENYDKHKEYIKLYNNMVDAKIDIMCKHYNIDPESLSPKTKEGDIKIIGHWDLDGEYSRFKTLGAKRYLVEFDNKDMEITIAGLGKKSGMEYMKATCNNDNDAIFNMFDNELYIPDYATGKLTHAYIDSRKDIMIQDYKGVECRVITESGVHLEKCEFTLSLTQTYINFIEQMKKGYLYMGESYQ